MKTVSEVIDALGGTTAAAEVFGVGPSAISNWRTWNEFPERVHFRVFRLCEERGIVVDESLFRTKDSKPAA